jgi:hypothetical protein
MIQALIEWDLDNLTYETVIELHGQEIADKWLIIRKYGASDFIKFKASGLSTMMAKEVLSNKLLGFLEIVTANPDLMKIIKVRELLEQIWEAMELNRKSPVLTEEEIKQQANNDLSTVLDELEQSVGGQGAGADVSADPVTAGVQ